MRGRGSDGSMLPMPAATDIAQPAVLVVHANFAVGSAMAERHSVSQR